MSSKFYRPLNLERDEIRLIVLQPGKGDDIVQVSIIHAFLSENPKYETLSYVWGDPKITIAIQLVKTRNQINRLWRSRHESHTEFQATTNLECAMRHLRYKNKSRTLWVDAICINQADELEKGHQIQRMGDIYREAVQVCLWLGEAAYSSDAAMELFETYYGSSEMRREELLYSPDWSLHWKAVLYLAGRPWFTRRWIVQEVVLASKSTVYCGNKSTHWGALFYVFTAFHTALYQNLNGMGSRTPYFLQNWHIPQKEGKAYTDGFLQISDTSSAIIALRTSGSAPLAQLLSLFFDKQVTNPRDAVLAVLGLAEENRTMKWMTDTSLFSIQSVFMAAVEISILGGRSLDIITLDFPPSTISLPSWIPHFYKSSDNLYESTALVTKGQPYIMKPLYSASGTSLPRAEISWSMSQLTAKGFVMDVVKVICEPCYLTGISERLPNSWKSTFLGLISMCTNAGHGQTASFTTDRKLIFDAFWRTLVLNRSKKTRVKAIAPDNWAVPAKDWCDGDMVVPPYSGSSAQETDPLRPENFLNNVILSLRARRLIVTETSRLGLASDVVQEGDLVVILFGCSVPVLIRKSLEPGQEGGYLLVGDAYVHGIMDGEAVGKAEYPVETFTLV